MGRMYIYSLLVNNRAYLLPISDYTHANKISVKHWILSKCNRNNNKPVGYILDKGNISDLTHTSVVASNVDFYFESEIHNFI